MRLDVPDSRAYFSARGGLKTEWVWNGKRGVREGVGL